MTKPDPDAVNRERTVETTASCTVTQTNNDPETVSDQWIEKVWSAGSYSEIAPKYSPMAGHLVEQTEISSEDHVLDIGCGTGTVAITAARRGAQVTGVDITPTFLQKAQANAEIAGIENLSWQEGDATDLPFDDNTFDVTVSNLGHMYGDPPDTAAQELLRVTRPSGRIGFTSWTPTSLYPSMAGIVMTVVPPENLPDFSEPPFLWGDTSTVQQRLGDSVENIEFETETVQYQALSPEHFWQQTATNSGMFVEVLEAVTEKELSELREQLIEAIEPYFDNRENAVELEYRLTTAIVSDSG